MTRNRPRGTRHILGGTIRVFTSEALVIPTGLATTIFLTRSLGPESYGLYGLAVSIIIWIEYSICALFSSTSLKFIGESGDWESIARTVLRLYLLVSVAAMVCLWLFSGAIGELLNAPGLKHYLSILAVDIPFYVLATAHRQILIGIGKLRERAFASMVRWIARLVFIVLLVELGLSVEGAILGIIGASALELAVGRYYLRIPFFGHSNFDLRKLWGFAAPLFLFHMSMRLFEKMDLFFVKGLGGSDEQAGIYVAAQNLSMMPGLFAMSFSPILLATLSRLLGEGDSGTAIHLMRNSFRAVLMLLPFAALTAGASGELTALVFGNEYRASAPILSILIFGTIASVFISLNYAILTASGRPGWPLLLTAPVVLAALPCYYLVIPRAGMTGAASVYALTAWLGAGVMVSAVYYLWRAYPPGRTFVRTVLISGAAFACAYTWHTPGIMVILKLSLISAGVLISYYVFGEFDINEIRFMKSMFSSKMTGEKNS